MVTVGRVATATLAAVMMAAGVSLLAVPLGLMVGPLGGVILLVALVVGWRFGWRRRG